ncbi:holin [Hazenella sp. IB182357]|uniref:Holin n=1 Tax=Polycladospora coralii TaxID=2771432 RepID=A0A926RV13_9BACL|nr:phage holin [Polycladospora coralii]MBD1373049.1 holin [Polycladospora coralii]MBS7529606.1 hypothetical protein [Polycladospora coralii]
MFKNKNRWKNAGLWVSIIAYIPTILASFQIQLTDPEWYTYEQTLKGIIAILVLLGILNDPTTNKKGFSDDK